MMENVNQHLTHRQRQALATRKLIVDSATVLFLEQGYAATTIEAIATHAGVAISTIYSIFTNKRGILSEIRQQWHAESQVKSIFEEAVNQHNPVYFLERLAYGTRRQWETSATMIAIYTSAAASDPEAAAELDAAMHGRRANIGRLVLEMAGSFRQNLRPDQAAAIVLALTRAEIYSELVAVAGWSLDAYEAWLAGVLKQQLLA
jgi:AcrR family transcriptional regulator